MLDRMSSAPGPDGNYLSNATCRYCGHHRIRVEWRMVATPLGTYSIAGAQMKFEATSVPFATCEGCGHESEGKTD